MLAKFADADYTIDYDLPVLTGAIASIHCEVVDQMPAGDHVVFLARPTRLSTVEPSRAAGVLSQRLPPRHRPLVTGMFRTDLSIPFETFAWADDVPGSRAREVTVDGRRWAIVEYERGARRLEWCQDGHAGMVLAGAVEYGFEDGGRA